MTQHLHLLLLDSSMTGSTVHVCLKQGCSILILMGRTFYLFSCFNTPESLDCPVVIAAIVITGLGGTFQYGFSVSVMTSPSAFIKELVNETCVHRYNLSLEQWQVGLIWSFTVSIFCVGGLLGSLAADSLTSKLGRKKCLLLNNLVAAVGAMLMLVSRTAMSFEMIMVGRFLYGINAGVGFSAHTMYLNECAPERLWGTVGVSVSTFLSLGKFCGQLLGIRELLGSEQNWTWLLAFNGFTALFQLLTLPFLPESPRFLLLEAGDIQASEKAFKRFWGKQDYCKEVEEMQKEKAALQNVRSRSVLEFIQNPTLRWQLLTILAVFTAVQLCGINAVYFYSFDVLRAAGIPEHKLAYAALGTGLCEVSTSVACFMVTGNAGRKVLLFRGYMAMSATLALLTVTVYLQSRFSWMPYCSMVLIFIFILCFIIGPGTTTIVVPGDILSQSFKSAGYTLGCTFNWISLFLLGMVFPILVENLGSFCFLIFLAVCLLVGLYVRFNMPETRNRTALEIATEFDRMHRKVGQSTEGEVCEVKTHETKL